MSMSGLSARLSDSMSFPLVALVIETDIGLPASYKLTLIVLADYLNKTTGLCNPSVAAIARKVGLSTKQIRVILRKLKELGFISVIKNSLGGAKGETCHFAIHQEKLTTRSTILKEQLANRTTPMSIPPTPLICVRGTPYTDVHNPSHPRALTPTACGSQTKDKPILTKQEVKASHGKEWKRKPEVVMEIGRRLGIEPNRGEGALDYADRIEKALN